MVSVGSLEFVENSAKFLAKEYLNEFVKTNYDEIVAAVGPYVGSNEVMECLSVSSSECLGSGRSQRVSKEVAHMSFVYKLYLAGKITGKKNISFLKEISQKMITFDVSILVLKKTRPF